MCFVLLEDECHNCKICWRPEVTVQPIQCPNADNIILGRCSCFYTFQFIILRSSQAWMLTNSNHCNMRLTYGKLSLHSSMFVVFYCSQWDECHIWMRICERTLQNITSKRFQGNVEISLHTSRIFMYPCTTRKPMNIVQQQRGPCYNWL